MLTIEQAAGLAAGELVTDGRLIESLQRIRNNRPKIVKVYRPALKSDFPELFVEVPDSWPHVDLAPLFDVHLGHSAHLSALFSKHHRWLMRTPYVLTFDGGDLIENANKLSVGSGVYEQDYTPDNQIVVAAQQCAKLWPKLLFKLPGNHEARTRLMGVDVARWVATLLEIPYFPDFCFLNILFAGNRFRILAHHGTGAATTAGAQRMAARKALPWAKFDIIWCFPPGTPVLTSSGYTKPIEELSPGDQIINGQGRIAKVASVLSRRFSGDLVEMRPLGWPTPIWATPNHPMLTSRRYGLNEYRSDFFRADALVYGDALHRVKPNIKITETPDVSPDEMRLYGYYLSEGCAWTSQDGKQNQLTFSFARHEQNLVFDCRRLLNKLGYKVNLIQPPNNNCTTLRVCSLKATEFFRNLLGHKCDGKFIPDKFLSYPNGHIRELLLGIYLGDGHKQRQGWVLTTTSRKLAEQVVFLLSRLGEPASLSSRKREMRKRSYEIMRAHSDGKVLWRKYRNVDSGWASPLRWVRNKPYDGLVYNLTVAGDDPTFVVGQFVVHNSGHLHNSLADPFFQIDFDQKTGLAFERNGFVIISPSYLGYWETYAASKMYPPGIAGMSVARLNRDGRIDVNLHARGRRL